MQRSIVMLIILLVFGPNCKRVKVSDGGGGANCFREGRPPLWKKASAEKWKV